MKHLPIPTLTAPTVDAFIDYAKRVREYNNLACSQIDNAHAKTYGAPASPEAKRDKKTGRQIAAERARTVPDILADSPEKLTAYKELMGSIGRW